MKEEKEDFTLDVRELSNEELVSILGAETTVIGKCPKCGGTNITATVSLPPLCVCMDCKHVWSAGEDGGTPATCGIACEPGCKSGCLTSGKK